VNAPRVILLTLRGPGGQVDVAAREDASVAELVAAVAESLGDTVVPATDTLDRQDPPPSAERAIPKTATLAQAGLLDGHVLTVSEDVVTVDDQVVATTDGSP
jgi:WXG100 protein secretion system (Wss), protein YukD